MATAVLQTAFPIVGQSMSQAIIIYDLLYAAMILCAGVGIGVSIYQAVQWRFGVVALILFYGGLAGLVAFDSWFKK